VILIMRVNKRLITQNYAYQSRVSSLQSASRGQFEIAHNAHLRIAGGTPAGGGTIGGGALIVCIMHCTEHRRCVQVWTAKIATTTTSPRESQHRQIEYRVTMPHSNSSQSITCEVDESVAEAVQVRSYPANFGGGGTPMPGGAATGGGTAGGGTPGSGAGGGISARTSVSCHLAHTRIFILNLCSCVPTANRDVSNTQRN
jgi:hypothetical protein